MGVVWVFVLRLRWVCGIGKLYSECRKDISKPEEGQDKDLYEILLKEKLFPQRCMVALVGWQSVIIARHEMPTFSIDVIQANHCQAFFPVPNR